MHFQICEVHPDFTVQRRKTSPAAVDTNKSIATPSSDQADIMKHTARAILLLIPVLSLVSCGGGFPNVTSTTNKPNTSTPSGKGLPAPAANITDNNNENTKTQGSVPGPGSSSASDDTANKLSAGADSGECQAAGSGSTYYVSTRGDDLNDGKSRQTPFATITHAFEMAFAGDCIQLLPGIYRQDIVTQRSGTKKNPITLTGLQPANGSQGNGASAAVIKGDGSDRVFQVRHSHIHLSYFTIDGLTGDPSRKSSYRNKLLYVHNNRNSNGLSDIKITHLTLRNAGGECLRLRYFVTDSEVSYSSISNCGVYAFRFRSGGKNGEAIYIGTSVNQWHDGKNPTADPDKSMNNRIHHNRINSQGNECVDLKEGTTGNRIFNNDCTGQRDEKSAGFNSAGNGNIFYNNTVHDNAGSGFRFGSNREGYGVDNIAFGNTIVGNRIYGFKLMDTPQKTICGNTLRGNNKGKYYAIDGSVYSPEQGCPGSNM